MIAIEHCDYINLFSTSLCCAAKPHSDTVKLVNPPSFISGIIHSLSAISLQLFSTFLSHFLRPSLGVRFSRLLTQDHV